MILVPGGTGLVGSYLLYRLTQNGEKVRALYRNEATLATVKEVFSFFTTPAETLFNTIEWYKADITDIPSLSNAFKEITHVYHCAALISFDKKDHKKLRKINIEGTANIVNLCILHGIQKLCYVSSIATLGEGSGALITEQTHWNANADNNSYAITKYGAEMEVWRGTQEGVPAVIVNPGLILGACSRNSGSGRLFNTVKKGFNYYTRGVTGYVDVEDVVEVMIKLMKSPIVNKRYILVAANESYREVLTGIAGALGLKPPKKELRSWHLAVLWRLDWLKNKIGGTQRLFTKNTARSVLKVSHYSSEAVKKELDFTFTPLHTCIKRVASRTID